MKLSNDIASGYRRIKIVNSLSAVLGTTFGGRDGVNCIYYPRKLKDDFNGLALYLERQPNHRREREQADSFHADGVIDSTEEKDSTLLCCYTDPVTEFWRNEDAVNLGGGFYRAKRGAPILRFSVGAIWHHAVMGAGKGTPKFVHRGPIQKPGDPLRLLLVAD